MEKRISMNKGIEIEFKNLSLTLGGNQILKDINFTVESGSIHCLIGPNGGGKSSLVKTILSLLPHTGEIELRYDKEKKISYVPQNLEFDKTLPITVNDFLTMIYQKKPCFLGTSRKVKDQIEDMLKEIDMYDKRDRLLGSLSGGELQRVLLTQALYPKPNLLILDEPFNGIDTVCETYFLKRIKELKNEGVTIIWIHHNLKQIVGIADKVTCIKKTVLFTGKPEEELIEDRIFDIFS